MEMTDMAIWLPWVGIIIVICAIGYRLRNQGKLSWLRGFRMPRIFEPKPDDLIDRLKAQTARERTRATKLREVLEAKTELAMTRAENIRLRKEIDGVSEKSVAKGKRAAETEKQEEVDVKPRRL